MAFAGTITDDDWGAPMNMTATEVDQRWKDFVKGSIAASTPPSASKPPKAGDIHCIGQFIFRFDANAGKWVAQPGGLTAAAAFDFMLAPDECLPPAPAEKPLDTRRHDDIPSADWKAKIARTWHIYRID